MPEYIQGAELDDMPISWLDADGDPYNFASGWTFSVKVGAKGAAATFTKTSGITGASTAPNITVTWATTGELNTLAPGDHTLQVEAIRTSDSRSLMMHDTITIIQAVV